MTQNEKELAKALLLAYLNNGLPSVPSDQFDADRQNRKIGLVVKLLDEITTVMLTRSGQLQRVIRGEAKFDERIRADQGREMAKLDAAITNTDGYAEWMKEQAELNRQRDEALSQQRKRERETQNQQAEYISRVTGH